MGADDYITKPFSQRLLIERVRAVLRRAEVEQAVKDGTAESVMRRGELVMDQNRHMCTWGDRDVTLTVPASLIPHALAQRPGHTKSRAPRTANTGRSGGSERVC